MLDVSQTNPIQNEPLEAQLFFWTELFNESGEATLVSDTRGRIVAVNKAFTRLTGYTPGEVIGQNANILKSGKHDKKFFEELWHTLNAKGYWQGEIWDRRKNGEVYPKWSKISSVGDINGVATHYIATYTDISEQKAAVGRIHTLVNYDVLTGLPNRTLFHDRLTMALAQAKRDSEPLAVLLLDLDRFKNVNNSFGHQVGDLLLKAVGQRIAECIRETDTLCRMGGDEFIILITGHDAIKIAIESAEKILRSIVGAFVINGVELHTTGSLGISVYPEDGAEQDTLIKNADTAMYNAKENGKNRYSFFTSHLNLTMANRLTIEYELLKALEREEFILFYQPQINISSLEVVGFEALVRWNKPGEGLISPDVFLPVAEDTRLSIPLGKWILKEVCRQYHEWRIQGFSPSVVGVNISANQFYEQDFVSETARIVEENSIPPSSLEIEITEGLVMGDIQVAVREMTRLKNKGFKISLDDFGTGYSSLSYLSRFPIDRLKIDQSFIRSMIASATDLVIVESIISLGKKLKLQLIAEGVEKDEEMLLLRERGCDEVQGYFYSKPLPANEVMIWCKKMKDSGKLKILQHYG